MLDPREKVLKDWAATIEHIVRIVCFDSQDYEDAAGIASMRVLHWLDGNLPEGVREEKRWITTTVAREVRYELYRREADRKKIEQRNPGRLRDMGMTGDYIRLDHVPGADNEEAAESLMVDGLRREVWKVPIVPDFTPDIESSVVVEQWLLTLPKEFAEVVYRHFVLQQTFREISLATGVKINTLLSRNARALRRLKDHLSQKEE